MSNLVDFLQQMGRDAGLADEFERDHEAVMSRFDLSDEEKQAVRDGDMEAIKRMSGLENVRRTDKSVTAY